MSHRNKPKYHTKPTWHHHDYEHEYPYSPVPYYWEWYEVPNEESDDYYRLAGKVTPKPKSKLGRPVHMPTPHHGTTPAKLYYDEYDTSSLEAYQCGFKDGFDTALMLVQNGTIPLPTPTPEPTPTPSTDVTTG